MIDEEIWFQCSCGSEYFCSLRDRLDGAVCPHCDGAELYGQEEGQEECYCEHCGSEYTKWTDGVSAGSLDHIKVMCEEWTGGKVKDYWLSSIVEEMIEVSYAADPETQTVLWLELLGPATMADFVQVNPEYY